MDTSLLRKPINAPKIDELGRYQRFNLSENPFPSEPAVNKESTDKRMNGNIYEVQIRKKEYEQILNNFIKEPQTNLNHLRLGYIIDSSYIGRGNGKSAFLINLLQVINKEYCLDLSNNSNKCFAVYVSPEAGGRTKTFSSFVDAIFDGIIRSNIISVCLAILRLEALNKLGASIAQKEVSELIANLNDSNWFSANKINIKEMNEIILGNFNFQDMSPEFPLFRGNSNLLPTLITQNDFKNYYISEIKKPKDKISFVFNELVKLFVAASFNGAYILIDDFERIPDFQSARQKRDFALELRSCLFDGLYQNARIGFYNLLLVLHAGVPRLINDAWSASGMENRAPINQTTFKHIIIFEKLNYEHAKLLIRKYLDEYRIDKNKRDKINPFSEPAIKKIGELSEYNAAKILRMSYELLDKAANDPKIQLIDEKFINENKSSWEGTIDSEPHSLDKAETADLYKKASE